MTFRISQFAALCGLSLLALPGLVQAQAPRYQSPLSVPSTPQPQVLPTPDAITPNGAVVEDVIVRVNDQIISRSDLERSEQQLAAELQQTGANSAEAEERQKNMLRDMIDQQLLLSRGKELGLNADAEVIRRLDEIRKQNHLDSMEDLEKAAREQGVSFEDFKANIKNGIVTQQVVRDEVGRRMQAPTQAQTQAFYEAHKQEFAQPEQIRLSEILVPLPTDANAAAIAQAKAKADDIAAKVQAGGKFDDLAKAYSGGPTAEQGGDLGLFKRGALAKVLEDQTFGLKAGEATSPIRTRQGFVILKVTDHQAAGVPALKDVEPQIQDAMYMQAMQPALRAYLTKLREDAYIDIHSGFVDTGASAKQTKPVFTAYSAPVPKKKKKEEQQKQRFERTRSTAKASTKPPVATPVSAVTTTPSAATSTTTTTAKAVSAKPKKIKKEKVRFGQAPRNALPAGSQETATTGNDVGQGAASAAVTPGGIMAQGNEAPGKAMAQPEGTSQVASSDADPLAPKAAVAKKTRYTDRIPSEAATKQAAKAAKAKEKAAAAPPPITTDEKATTQTQAAPLGLNGDTAKKQKPAKFKGAPKERLQNKDTTPPPPPPPPAPTVNPALGATPPGTTPVTPTPAPATPPPATPPAAPQN